MRARLEGWAGQSMLSLVVVLSGAACGDDAEPDSSAGAGGTTDGAVAGASGAAGGTDAGPVNPAGGCPPDGPTRAELGDALEPIPAAAGIRELVVTSSGLYFGNADGVQRLDADGTTATPVAASDYPDLLSAGEGDLAWQGVVGDMEGIWTVPLGSQGATPALVTEEGHYAENMAVDATHVYFDGSAGDGLRRAPLAGGAPQLLDTPFGVSALTLAGGFVYYSETFGEVVLRVPVAGGTVEEITPPGGYSHLILVDETVIYTSGNYSIVRFDPADASSRKAILRHAPSGMSIDNTLRRMILDGDRIVFADRRDNVGWVAKDGSDCAYVIAEMAEVGAVYRTDIALDADYLYLIDLQEHELFRIARSAVGL